MKSNMRVGKSYITFVTFAFKAADCATECLSDKNKCNGFLFWHKKDGEPAMDENCVLVDLPDGFDSTVDTMRVDGQLDVVDFYERMYVSNSTDTGDGGAAPKPLSGAYGVKGSMLGLGHMLALTLALLSATVAGATAL